MASQTKCTSGLSCRDGSARETQAAMLLKAKTLDSVLSHKGPPPPPSPPWWWCCTFLPTPSPTPARQYSGVMYYNEAHMVLTDRLITWAMSKGANSVEIDIAFRTGGHHQGASDQKAWHGPDGLCDCSCVNMGAHTWGLFGFIKFGGEDHLCGYTWRGGAASHCEEGSDLKHLYRHIATYKHMTMLHLDNKNGDDKIGNTGYDGWLGWQNNVDAEIMGRQNVEWFLEHCEGNGFGGGLTVGIYSDTGSDQSGFVVGAVKAMQKVDKTERLWLAWECVQEGPFIKLDKFVEGFNNMHHLVTDHRYKRARCDGITSCLHDISFHTTHLESVQDDVVARNAGRCEKSIIWTVDNKDQILEYLDHLVDAIMTNKPTLGKQARDEQFGHRTYW